MTRLVKREPLRRLRHYHDYPERFFSDFEKWRNTFGELSDSWLYDSSLGDLDYHWHPAVDIIEEDKDILVKLDIPGVDEKKINISFDGHVLAISGERKGDIGKKVDGYLTRQRFSGRFHRIIHLPITVESKGLKAKYNKGVLEILIPKKKLSKKKAIKVDVKS